MTSRVFAVPMVASLLLLTILASTPSMNVINNGSNIAYAQDDLWYVGEGAKQDMYVKYRIRELDTNDGRPYEMTIYFKEQQNGDWIAPTFIVDQGRVIKGTLKLGDNLAPLGGSSDIPPEMNTYISGYRGSLQWLESFTTKSEPQSLTARSWGRIAAIGGEEIRPQGQETITVPAGTYQTTVVGWHKGVDNKIWILNEFPYPIKAETFAEVTSGQPPTLFAFELLETGTGEPEAPAGEVQIPEPPLEKRTGRGTYIIRLDWEPASIEPGQDVVFGVSFFDNTGFPLERVNYDLTIKDANGETIQELKNQFADDGIGQHQITFEDAGAAKITVKINAVSGQSTGNFVESTDYDIVVVPEFPISAAIVAGVIIGFVVLMTRARRTTAATGLSRLFGRIDAL